MDIKKVFLEKFCHQMMNLDGSNKHYVIDPIVIDSPQFIIDWIKQQVKVEPEVIVNFAEIQEEFEEKFRHLDENPKLVYSKYSISDLWKWFEQKLKDVSKISE